MKSKNERKLSMYLVVADYLAQNGIEPQATIPKFGNLLASFATGIPALQHTREAQELNRSGKAVGKEQLKALLIAKTVKVARAVRAYALNEGSEDLAAAVHYSKSVLLMSADTILRDRCQVIHDVALGVGGNLGDYGVLPRMLEDLKAAIYNFNASIPTPREAIVARSLATQRLDEQFDHLDTLLAKMDILMELVRDEVPDFFDGYRRSRLLVNVGYRTLSVRGVVRDMQGKRINLARIKPLTLKGEWVTTEKGNFQMKYIPDGEHLLEVSKPGYKTKTVPITVVKGQRFELEVVLE